MYISGSQTFLNCYPNQGSGHVLLLNKNFLHFLSKISFAVIARNTEQQCAFGSALPPENRILPLGGNLPPVWESLIYMDNAERY